MCQIERFCPLLRLPQYRQSDIGGGGWGFVSPEFEFRYNGLGLSRNFEKAIEIAPHHQNRLTYFLTAIRVPSPAG